MKTQKARSCPGCGYSKFTKDLLASAGDVICSNCGMVQEENPIVSEVQFGESSSGAAMVQGSMVGADQVRANFNMRNAMESREQTLLNAKKKIKRIASVMRIPDYIVESALGWFKLALVQNFVQGRRSQNVIAACLYVACRHEKTHHLLIDFSLRLQISVYSLGATYLKLVRALQIQRLPLADPSLFIQHFAEKLQFGDQTARVCRDATKIAQRMSLDWIFEGRRPAGIAGACLLLAARMNNFRRTHSEIVAVARVGEETLQKRLNEFKKTTSGTLTIKDFRTSDHSNDSMPPSYMRNRRIEKKVTEALKQREQTLRRYQVLANQGKLASTVLGEDEANAMKMAAALKMHSRGTKLESQSKEPLPSVEKLRERRSIKDQLRSTNEDPDDYGARAEQLMYDALQSMGEQTPERPLTANHMEESEDSQRKRSGAKFAKSDALMKAVLQGGDISEEDIERALDKILEGQKKSSSEDLRALEDNDDFAAQFERDCPRNLVANNPTTADVLLRVKDDVELGSSDEDDELYDIKLSGEEVLQKERIWTALNHDFLIAQEKKRLKMEADELTGNTSGQTRKRRKVKQQVDELLNDAAVANAIKLIGEGGKLVTPAESAKQMLQRKLFSRKINYDTISDLFGS